MFKTTETKAAILTLISKGTPLSPYELSERLGIRRSTIHAKAHELIQEGKLAVVDTTIDYEVNEVIPMIGLPTNPTKETKIESILKRLAEVNRTLDTLQKELENV